MRYGFLIAAVSLALTTPAGAHPVITALNGESLAPNARLRVVGAGFGNDRRGGRVLVGGRDAVATRWSDTRIHAYVPGAAEPGPASVRVVTARGESNPAPLTVAPRRVGRGSQDRVLWSFQTDDRTHLQFITRAPDGTIYTADNTATYALSPEGDLLWANTDASGDAFGARPIGVGADGTVYTGVSPFGAPYTPVVAINPDGTTRWAFLTGGVDDLGCGPNVGPDGNIYGVMSTEFGGPGAFSLDPDGNPLWANAGDPPIGLLNLTTTSDIEFGADRFHAGIVRPRSGGNPVYYTFDLDGNQLWQTYGLRPHITTFPVMDPQHRVICAWGQTGIRALNPDGEQEWFRLHPNGISFILRPAVDADGVIYTGDSLGGGQLWALNPDGSTRYVLPPVSGEGNYRIGITPDGAVLVGGGFCGNGRPQCIRAQAAADGAFLWGVPLPDENGLPQFMSCYEPAFTPDGTITYVTTQFAGGSNTYGYVLAIQAQDPCSADWNNDGAVDSDDFFTFLDDYFQGFADFNGDGSVDSNDYFSFLAVFFEGCR